MANDNDLTPEDKQGRRQINQYDKVLRENMEAALPGLIKNLLHIDALETEELPDDIQHTKERKPDVLKKVRDKNDTTFVLHIELQVKDEPDMVLRMAEYFIMLYRRYRLPVRQYVVYLGENSPGMTDHFHSEQMDFRYQLIIFSTVDYHLLLRSENPEEKILAILANLGEKDPIGSFKNIVNQVVKASEGDFSKQRYIQQLRILAQLRKFTQQNLDIMDDLTGYFTKEKDFLYIMGEREGHEKGLEKGAEKKSYEVVKNLLLANQFTISQIAKFADVPESFVEKVKKTLN